MKLAFVFLMLAGCGTKTVLTDAQALDQATQIDEESLSTLAHALAAKVAVIATEPRLHLRVSLDDQACPLVVDIVANLAVRTQRTSLLLTGSALNFEANFHTPSEANVADFLADRGSLVVGLTWREDSVPADSTELSFMRDWGAAMHLADLERVADTLRSSTELPLHLLGYSLGAMHAMDLAARQPSWVRYLTLLDVPSFADAEHMQFAADSLAATEALRAHNELAEDGVRQLRSLVAAAAAAPLLDSGVARPVGASGNFTLAGLLHFSTMFVSQLPGKSTPITGRPESWHFVQGYFAGSYQMKADPQQDAYLFSHSDLARVTQMALAVNSGLLPSAEARDFMAWLAGSPTYTIPLDRITARVHWINSQLGFGTAQAAAAEMTHANVTTEVIGGYGHFDLLSARDAEDTVWPRLVP